MASTPLLRGAVQRIAAKVASTAGMPARSKDQERALPRSKGSEEINQLQTYTTQIFTKFTEVGGTQLLYSAENFVRVTLLLEDAGPVAVGTLAVLTPVLSGRGVLLQTDVPFGPFTYAKGTRIYIAAESVNRVQVIVEPIPWLEQLDLDIARVGAQVAAAASTIVAGVSAAVAGLRGVPGPAPSPQTSGGTRLDQLPPAIPRGRGIVPRLTALPGPPKMRR